MKTPAVAAFLLVCAAGCGSRRAPPPKLAEESIATSKPSAPASDAPSAASSSPTSSSGSAGSTSASSGSSAAASASSARAGTKKDGAAPGTASSAATSAKGSPGGASSASSTSAASDPPRGRPGPRLTAAECTKMLDRYVELVITAPSSPFHGVTGKDLADAREQVKTAAASDPVYVELQGSCRNELRKSNYTCAMAATTVAAWQDCAR